MHRDKLASGLRTHPWMHRCPLQDLECTWRQWVHRRALLDLGCKRTSLEAEVHTSGLGAQSSALVDMGCTWRHRVHRSALLDLGCTGSKLESTGEHFRTWGAQGCTWGHKALKVHLTLRQEEGEGTWPRGHSCQWRTDQESGST